jgi:hypothetical protein
MIRTLFLLLLPALASAQVLDTTYFTTVNGQLFQTSRVVYEDGTYTESRILTDTARVVTITARKIEGQAVRYAEYAEQYSTYRQMFNRAIALDAAIRAQLGRSPIALIQASAKLPLMDTLATWVGRTASGDVAALFTETQAGALRVKFGNDDTRQVVILGDMMRIANYPTQGNPTFFYKVSEGRWQDVTGTFGIVRTGLRTPPPSPINE